MPANYEIWLTDDHGLRLASLDGFIRLEASRVANQIAPFYLQAPVSFDPDLVAPDRMVQVWRQPEGGRLGLWRVYFLRKWKFSTQGSRQMIEMEGPDTNDLLRRRIVAAYAGSAQASKSDAADDMMKEVVAESIADGVAPTPDAGTRVWSDLSIAADLGLGPTISKSFAFDYLLTTSGQGVLPALANAARIKGTEVFFDIAPNVVASDSIDFRFETTIDQPGQDVSASLTFDQASGNMKNPELEYDYTKEENYIYAAGPGQKSDRNVQQVYDSGRYSVSQWARCEGFADARSEEDDDNAIADIGNDRLNQGRPRIRFSAQPVDTEGTRFGIDWDFGYKAGAKYLNRQFTSIFRAVTIVVDKSGEDVQARLDYEGTV